jgi:hypothetical protein
MSSSGVELQALDPDTRASVEDALQTLAAALCNVRLPFQLRMARAREPLLGAAPQKSPRFPAFSAAGVSPGERRLGGTLRAESLRKTSERASERGSAETRKGMTLRLGAIGVCGLLLVLGCSGNTAPSVEDPPPPNAEACVIVNDNLVLPSDGGCRLSAQQRANYRLQGADPACNAGRVEFGGLSGGRVNLNGLQIRCESGAELPDMPSEGTARVMTDELTPSGGPETSVPVMDVDPLAGDVSGDVSIDGPPSAPLLVTEWTRLEDEFSTGCDLVNGADFEAIVPTDGSGRLVVVSRLDQDVGDFVLPELILDEDYVARAEPSGEVVARIRYKQSADGLRQPWLVRPDGRAWSLAEDAAGTSPRTAVGALCQACDRVDGADPSTCAAAPSRIIPSEGLSPLESLLDRSSLLVEGETGRVLTWRDFDSAPGTRCGVINASDSSFAVVGDGFNRIPDPENLDQAPAPMPEGFSLRFIPFEEVPFEEPSTSGTWQLIGPDAAERGELVFTQDSTDQLRLWLVGLDGTVLDSAFEPSGITPEDLPGAPCDPCTFLAGTRLCVPLP